MVNGKPSSVQIWFSATRPRTLPAAVAPVLVATALAWRDGSLLVWPAAACLGFALLIQIATNFSNDYFDFKKGADTEERIGPKRAVASGWVSPATMRRAMLATFALAFVVGLSLLPRGGLPLLGVGVASILCGIAYTGGPFPLAYKGLGDVFVFIFFGLVAVNATYFVQAQTLTADSVFVGAAIGVLAVNILLVNNYRDADTDARAGKRTLVVRLGKRFARAQFLAQHLVALGIFVWACAADFQRWQAAVYWTAFALLVFFALGQVRSLRTKTSPAEQIVLLGGTGKYLVVYALVFSAALVFGGGRI